MKRFALGILIVLALTLVGGVQARAAASARGTRPTNGISGKVASVSGSTITVTTPQGTASVLTTSSTTFQIDGASGSLSGLKAGMFLHAEGTRAADGSFTATRVVASSTRPSPPARPSR